MAKTKKNGFKNKKISVGVKQSAFARTGQGGNPIFINASDIGVGRTDVRNCFEKEPAYLLYYFCRSNPSR